jgi:hypothetical protein
MHKSQLQTQLSNVALDLSCGNHDEWMQIMSHIDNVVLLYPHSLKMSFHAALSALLYHTGQIAPDKTFSRKIVALRKEISHIMGNSVIQYTRLSLRSKHFLPVAPTESRAKRSRKSTSCGHEG